ncbi:phage holin family protein [Numidum massiliense]|uniref:phage holin family protein n=1 Tax=Numidum massiliense TaxID=1522315 RepID=UPI0006D57990|nr:phage holin family protein [Numidum massiliense]
MENIIKTSVAVAGAAASFLWGGWSSLLSILLAFVVIDYASGVLAAAKQGELSSEVGGWGIAKKVFIFAIVAVAHLIDTAIGEAHVFRDATIFFYLANEVLSIIENAGVMGLPIPAKLKGAVDVLNQKGDDKQ